jgi:non-specific serine/threonine protein kinase/serine/threonine-protein kinase
MNATRWQKTKDLFALVLEQPVERRKDFLREACGDDLALREEVESLLEANDETGLVLERNEYGVASVFKETGTVYAGKEFGHYKVIREIGRGGMGAVFLAERADGEFQQQVALKIVRRTFGDSELARRFRRERQILASLNHPNIARLLDGGVSNEGEPFLVMEYVEGVRIDNYCDEQNLSTGERLQLFLAVCQGVSYAHQNLVVHRDIKPSNVLVTTDGVPKLLDFGIAKLLDAEHADEHTETGFRAFTPDYAAPEQIRGEQITTASDVYSLGVLLHDLLHGARHSASAQPAAALWPSESAEQRTVATNLPTNKESGNGRANVGRQKLVSIELKNIITMARRDEPARRYASVAQLAEDIQRYLDGLPVRAQKDSFTYRTGKFVRRNKVGVGATTLIALSLIIGFAAALWQANVARRERDRAERRFSDVRQLSNALLTEIAPKIERLPGATEARQALLTQSLKYLDSLANEASDDPGLQSELASAYEKVGDLQGNPTNPNLIALTDALASYEKANAMRRRLLERSPRDFEQRRLLANNYRSLGDIRWQTNEPTEALKNTEAALSLYSELLAEQPGSTELRLALARANLDIGKTHSTNEKYPEAISSFQKAVALLVELQRQSPDGIEVLMLLAESHKQMGNSLAWDGKQKEAEAEVAQAVAMSESLAAANPYDNRFRTGLWQTYIMASSVYEEVNDPLSNEYAFKALKVIEEMVEKDPANVRARQQLSRTYSRLGVTLDNTGKSAESILYLGKAVQIVQELVRNETKNRRFKYDLATAFIRLGDSRYKQRDFPGAIQDLEQAAAILTELVNTDAADNASLRNLANAYDSLAKTYVDLAAQSRGEKRESHQQAALQNYRRAIDILRQLEARGALSKYDRKSLEELQATVEKMSAK